MASFRKSLFLSNFATFGNLFISLALVVVVSRLLEPAEIGAFLIAFAVIMLIEPLREFELKSYIIVAETLDRSTMQAVRMVAWITAAAALVLCLIGSWVLSANYETPTPGNCLLIMCLLYATRTFSHPAEAILARDLRYGALAGVKIAGALVRAGVTLGLIWHGFGAEALAWGVVAEAATELLCLALVDVKMRWGWPGAKGTRQVWTFCAQLTGAQASTRVAAALEPLMIGTFQGLAMTAFYNRGNRLVRIFRSGIEQATLPIALSHFARAEGDREAVKLAYLRAVGLLTGLSWPVLGAFIVLAEPMILTLFGQQWGASVGLGQILAIGGFFYAASALSQQVHAALGETAILMKRDAILACFRIAILIGTAFISTAAVAWGLVVVIAISQVVHVQLLSRSIALTYTELGQAVWKSAIVGLSCAIGALIAVHALPFDLAAWQIVLASGAIVTAIWFASISLVKHTLYDEMIVILATVRK
ncbi:MAG: oligosaccharide flippase family protein [Erythrobacter sp.]